MHNHVFSSEEESNLGISEFWAPNLSVEKRDGEALLLLSDPTLYLNYVGPLLTHPDFYNVLVSEDLETFTLYRRGDCTVSKVKVENLENDKPYYFKIAAVVSDRSGRNEVWMYDIGVESYRQVTGNKVFSFSRYSNLQWLDDSNLLIIVSLENRRTVVTISVN